MEKEQSAQQHRGTTGLESGGGTSMAAPAFQLKASASTPIQRKVSPDYDKIKGMLSTGFTDWAVTDGEVSDVLSLLNQLNDTDLTDTVNKLIDDSLYKSLMSNLTDPEVRQSHQALYFKLLERISEIKENGAVGPGMCRIPVAAASIGADFESYLGTIAGLEKSARADGYNTFQVVTALRKIYYDSSKQKEYGGTTVGGGAWGILIPGAETGIPPSWKNPTTEAILLGLKKTQTIQIAGKPVDIGHLFAGVDAVNHPTAISIAYGLGVNMRSNIEATTWSGDLGSVVGEYILKEGATAKGRSMHDITNTRDNDLLNQYFDNNFSAADMHGDMDVYNFRLDHSLSVTENLRQYYSDQQENKASKRFSNFAQSVGFLKSNGSFNEGFKNRVVDEVMEATIAYTASKGRKDHVLLVRQGPQAFVDDHWDLYYNVTGWCADLFLERLKAGIAAEK